MRGDPDGFDLVNGVRWGFGAATPSRRSLRLTAELHGEFYLDDAVVIAEESRILGEFIVPADSPQDGPVNATIGLTWQGRRGVFAGAALNWSTRLDGRSEFGNFEDERGDSLGFQVRVGYHPGVRVYVPPPHLLRRRHRRRRRTGRRRSEHAASRARSKSAGRPRSWQTRRIPTGTR